MRRRGVQHAIVSGKSCDSFSGLDCRFPSVKKSETIYVYYKLSGRRRDLWAGSVGSNFGYFPKDLLAVNHQYTDKELEVPAEETDFVCFDTGYDKFDNYDVDSLLGSSLGENDGNRKAASDQSQAAEDAQKETQPSANEAADEDKKSECHDNIEALDKVPDDERSAIPEPDAATESFAVEEVESETEAWRHAT